MALGNHPNKNSAQNQNLLINKISFSHPEKEKAFAFTTVKKQDYFRFSIKKLSENVVKQLPEKLLNETFIYTQFNQQEDETFSLKINLSENPSFCFKYYTWLIHEHLKEKADFALHNFINDNEFWYIDDSLSNETFNTYRKFTIKVDFEHSKNNPELVISYDGVSKVLKQNIEQLSGQGISTNLYGNVVSNKYVNKYKRLTDKDKYHLEQVFPVLNVDLHLALKIPFETPDKSNKYKKYLSNLNNFFKNYINTPAFKAIIPHNGNWQTIPSTKIFRTTLGSNSLKFGENHTNIFPYDGMKTAGPVEIIDEKHVKIFFIYHSEDVHVLEELKKYISKEKGFISFTKFLRFPFSYDDSMNLVFADKDNPIPDVLTYLENFNPEPETAYLAFYISPHCKEEKDIFKHSHYYRIKEELLKNKISSQVIESSSVFDVNFKYFVSNIAIAVLAKLGGIPWRLDCEPSNELIVGVGAFRPITNSAPYIGSAFCFSNTGHFNGFEAHPADDIETLAGSIGTAVENYYKSNNNPDRLVIHFYKTMSKYELKPIMIALRDLDIDIPVITISINKTESKDLVLFDTNYSELMPLSGTYVPIDNHKYLLCNNTRYSENTTKIPDSFSFPIKMHIQSTDSSIFEKPDIIKKLIDQTYQFSRMYWKSVKQQNLPVTIKYPEMVAEIFPHFQSDTIPPFGQNNLWFL
jgi:hypothetical protein